MKERSIEVPLADSSLGDLVSLIPGILSEYDYERYTDMFPLYYLWMLS
jgi:hypothetical protein